MMKKFLILLAVLGAFLLYRPSPAQAAACVCDQGVQEGVPTNNSCLTLTQKGNLTGCKWVEQETNYCVCKTVIASPDGLNDASCTQKLYYASAFYQGRLLGIACDADFNPALQVGCDDFCESLGPNSKKIYCGNEAGKDEVDNTPINQAKGCAPIHCWCGNPAGYCTHDTVKPNGGSFYDRPSCNKYCDDKNVNGETGWKSTHWDDKYTNYYKIPVSNNGCLYEIPRPKISPYDFTGNIKLNAINLNPLTKFRGPQDFLGNAIRVILSLIGALVLVMYIYGGLLWMTAAGNSEQTGKAKQILVWSTLGVAVMLSSYVLVTFLFRDVLKLTI
ncbi:MAG: pilin [Candidatus Magasanikbacteria bacterium]|nr:pilin [Candidatus Magasanikbacteria bacterium]